MRLHCRETFKLATFIENYRYNTHIHCLKNRKQICMRKIRIKELVSLKELATTDADY